ncbi:hypothetical protein GY45DRAFT_1321703 [Cubamyces sp. BRFM 1775]|nr:hypothetical protein GY45DRAFT_1321703 [Cubamyces sp. BRFM 1775]
MCELRFRKGLILVCKNWSGPATEALYEDVVLRRMGQIPALATALTTSWNAAVAIDQRNLADCVNSIRIDSCGVLPEYADEIHDALRTILERCTSLGVFEVHVDAALPTTVDQSGGTDVFFPVWLLENDTYPELQRAVRGRLTTLRALDLSVPLSGTHVLRHLHQALLQCASTLETLKLGPYTDSADEEYDMSTLPLLSLPRLQELYVHTARNKLYYDLLCTMWNMPTLQRLTTLGDGSVPYRLLFQHGSHLRYLHLFPRNRSLPDITGIERVPEFCPALEHLVVAARSYKTQPFIPALKSDTLRYLDIWTCHEYTCRRWKKVLEAPPESALPALRSVRRLSDLRVDLPRICHPATELADGERVLYSVPNATYLQTRTHVMSDLQHLCMRHLSPKVNAGIESGHIRRPCWIAESFANAGELNQPTVLPADPSSSVASDEEYESDGGDRSECDVGLDNESDGSDYKPKDDGSDDESDVSDEWCSEGVSDA